MFFLCFTLTDMILKNILSFIILVITKSEFSLCDDGEIDSHILYGIPTTIHPFPHSVLVLIDCMTVQSCGASLLNQDIVLTAAHCLFYCAKMSWEVEAYAGHHNVNMTTMYRKAIWLQIHDDFNPNTFVNDIGLIKVDRSFILGPTVKRVSIHHTKQKFKELMVAGWGMTLKDVPEMSDDLMFTSQMIITNRKCPQKIRTNPGIFCSQGTDRWNSRPTRGDSGCAYVTKDYLQIGLVSYEDERYPDLVFNTNVTYHYGWIRRQSERMFCRQKGY